MAVAIVTRPWDGCYEAKLTLHRLPVILNKCHSHTSIACCYLASSHLLSRTKTKNTERLRRLKVTQ
jgi:hypothetical protein